MEKEELKKIGQRLDALKARVGAMVLPRISGISYAQINRLIKGDIPNPGIASLNALAKAGNTTLEWIITGNEESRVPKKKALSIPDEYLARLNVNGETSQIFIVPDDAMSPTLSRGCAVVIDTSLRQQDGIYLINYNERQLIRRLSFLNDTVNILCDNLVYKEVSAVPVENLVITGMAVLQLASL